MLGGRDRVLRKQQQYAGGDAAGRNRVMSIRHCRHVTVRREPHAIRSQRVRSTLTPLALIELMVRDGVEEGTTTAATSDNEVTTNAEAASNFSDDARTIVSAERSCRARFTAASSASPVLSPAFGCTPVTPMKYKSALSLETASINAAPTLTIEWRNSLPPSMTISIVECAASSTATFGLCVISVALRFGARCRATWMAVVPPSRMTTWPD